MTDPRRPRPILGHNVLVSPEGISVAPVNRVRQLVAERLGEQGWSRVEDDRHPRRDWDALATPLRDDFSATLDITSWLEDIASWLEGIENDVPTLCAVGVLGLDYEPARRITTALTGSPTCGVVLKEPCLSIALRDEADANAAADLLVRFASEHAPSLAELADVDKVLGLLRERRAAPASEPRTFLRGNETPTPAPGYHDLPDPLTVLIPALLAAAGRYEDARRDLAACAQPSWLQVAGKRDLRLARQLTRWIDHEGKLPLPTTPARWPAQWSPPGTSFQSPPSIRAFMAEQMPAIHARQQAVRAVRAVSEGKSREEIRQLLRGELDKRDVKMQPVEFEQRVNFLATEREPLGKARLVLRALKDLADTQEPGLVALLRHASAEPPPEPEQEPDPAWARTPDRAAYPIWSVTKDRVAVELDADAAKWLDELMSGSRGRFGNRNVEVWLSRGEATPSNASALIVHVGSKRIGSLDPPAGAPFHAPIEAAAEREEDVVTDARLTRMEGRPPYVLDLPLP